MGDDEKLVNDVEPEEESEETPKEEAPSTDISRIVRILLWVVGAVLVLAAMFGISWLVANYVQEKKYQREQDIVVAPPPPPLAHFDLPTFNVTTKDPEPHFVKVTLSLGYDGNPEMGAELGSRIVELQHVINILVGGKKYDELNSVEDKVGLAEEIKSHVNVLLIAGKIKEVYFKEFIVN
jgi:flagellar basal body-associated protein FliL